MMFLAGLFLGWAYLIKETAVFFGVFIAGYMGYRFRLKKTSKLTWLAFWSGVFLILAGEFGYYALTTGNPFFRYISVEAGHNASIFSGAQFHGLILLRRLTIDIFRMAFHVSDFSFVYVFAIAGAIYALQNRKTSPVFFSGWFFILLFLLNFGSSSLSTYAPLLLFYRFFIMLSVPCILLASWYLYEMRNFFAFHLPKDLRAMRISLLIPSGLFGIITLWRFSLVSMLFLFSLACWLLFAFSMRLRNWCTRVVHPSHLSVLFPLFFLCINILPGLYTAAQGERARKGGSYEREIRPLFESPLKHTIYTDERTKESLDYFYSYQEDSRIMTFFDVEMQQWHKAYVVVNWERLFFLNRLYHTPIPEFLYHPPSGWRPYAQLGGNVNPCLIYEIP